MAAAEAPPAVVVIAGPAPGGTDEDPGPHPVSAALRRLLLSRALAWAGEVRGAQLMLGVDPAWSGLARRAAEEGSGVECFELQGPGFGRRLEQVCERLFTGGIRPVLIVWPQLARWRSAHAAAALEDLASGCGIVLGPLFDGGAYLIGLDRPQPVLWSLTDEQWQRPDAWSAIIGAANEAGALLGLLRAERGLRREQDIRAALVDPLTDAELRHLLG